MENVQIGYIQNDPRLVVQGRPEVTVVKRLAVRRGGGEVLATLDATYDFSKVPPEFHNAFLFAISTALTGTYMVDMA